MGVVETAALPLAIIPITSSSMSDVTVTDGEAVLLLDDAYAPYGVVWSTPVKEAAIPNAPLDPDAKEMTTFALPAGGDAMP